jgi:hypothetical protein
MGERESREKWERERVGGGRERGQRQGREKWERESGRVRKGEREEGVEGRKGEWTGYRQREWGGR